MGFIEAIKSGYSRTFDFWGRSSRSEYWFWYLYQFIGSTAMIVFGFMIGFAMFAPFAGFNLVPVVPLILWSLWTLVHFITSLSMAIRRCHDASYSGFFILFWYMLPLVAWLIMTIMPSTPGKNDFGENPYGVEN